MTACSGASIKLYGSNNLTDVEFDIWIVPASSYSIDTDDYSNFPGRTTGSAHTSTKLNDTFNTTSFAVSSYNTITFNAAGRAAILAAQGGTLRVAFLTSYDYSNTAPAAGDGRVYWTSSGQGDEYTDPYLSITYTPPVVAPTVTTQAATDVDTDSCTGNGNITDTGGANCTRRGFCYMEGSSGDPTTANSTAYDDGSFGTGAYTKSITGLSPSTNYRVRAYAVNSAGTGYGTTVDVTTAAAPIVVNGDIVASASVAFGQERTTALDMTAAGTASFSQERTQQLDIQVTASPAFSLSREQVFDIVAAAQVGLTGGPAIEWSGDIGAGVSVAFVQERTLALAVVAEAIVAFGQERTQPAFDVAAGGAVEFDQERAMTLDTAAEAEVEFGQAREQTFDVAVDAVPVFGQERTQPAFDVAAVCTAEFGQSREQAFDVVAGALLSATWFKRLTALVFKTGTAPSMTMRDAPSAATKTFPQTS